MASSFVDNKKLISTPPPCLLVEHKKAVLLTLVALAAIGALVIGALAMSGVGSISQLGLPGGGAVAGLGFFALMVIGGYCVYKRCCSTQSTKKRVSDDSESDSASPRAMRKGRINAGHSSRREKAPARSSQRPVDYRQAELRDLFVEDHGAEFDTLDEYRGNPTVLPNLTQMTAPVMKGETGGHIGKFVCIKLQCISSQEEILDSVKDGTGNDVGKGWIKDGYKNRGVLTLFKKEKDDGKRVWVQASNGFHIPPAFLRSFDSERLTDAPLASSDRMPEEEKVANEIDGFARLQTLLGLGEVTDCRGLKWKIIGQ